MSERNAPRPPRSLQLTEHQAGVYMEIPRSQILGCPYNPRRISSYARGLLKKKLETVGCVTPIVWNRRTGFVVSGNQRLSCLDELEAANPGYIVGVIAIDVDEATERLLNVQFNNRQSQGQFDKDSFLALIQDGSLDLAEAGMTRIDLELEFGRLPEIAGIFAQEQAMAAPVAEQLQTIADQSPLRKEAAQAVRKETLEKILASPSRDGNYFAVVVFETGQKAAWMEAHGLDPKAPYLLASQVIPLVRR